MRISSRNSLTAGYRKRGDRMRYFNLTYPYAESLWADYNKEFLERLRIPCTLHPEHLGESRRIGPLNLEVKHNRRDEMMIWTWSVGVHERILEGFQREGFTGYRLKPAIVRFRDGLISNEYHELVVTGWAGTVSPESGMQLKETCTACHYRLFTAITDHSKMIDWSQWRRFLLRLSLSWPHSLHRAGRGMASIKSSEEFSPGGRVGRTRPRSHYFQAGNDRRQALKCDA